jgi:DNA polymerase-3 subunit epsilon
VLYSLKYQLKQWRYRKKAAGTPLQSLYEHPPIDASQRVLETRFLAVDCEMSGLDASSNQLLSIGWVVIEHGRIVNAKSRHLLIQTERGAGDSSRIHGLHDSSLAGANSLAAVLMLLIEQMPGTVLVFHHAGLDTRFIQNAALETFRCPLLFSYLDTLLIEKRRLKLQGKMSGLRLAQCRQRYGLVSGGQHNALADAQATAELFLAQISYTGALNTLRLSDLGLHVAG